MRRKKLKIKNDRWCEVEVRLEDGRLSITGSEGVLMADAAAREQAKQYWEYFFDDNPAEIIEMNRRCGSKCCDSKSAAEHVIEVDGPYHGLDIHGRDGDKVLVLESCGQIVETLGEFFPEVTPYLKWHLNDMKAACVHQEELGWGRGYDVAITRHDATQAQRTALYNLAREAAERDVDRYELEERKAMFRRDPSQGRVWLASLLKREVSIDDMDALLYMVGREDCVTGYAKFAATSRAKKLEAQLRKFLIDSKMSNWDVKSRIYKDSLGAPCPTCGYCYGSAWLKRELPPEVVAWAENFGKDGKDDAEGEGDDGQET